MGSHIRRLMKHEEPRSMSDSQYASQQVERRLLLVVLLLSVLAILPFVNATAGTSTTRTSSEGGGTTQASPVRYQSLRHSHSEWYGSTFWTGPDWTRVGKNWHHPGQDTPSVRRFECPRDGRVSVTGRVFKLHLGGDGVRAMIRHNDREVWRTDIEGKDGKGLSHELALEVKRGDAIRFVVHKRGQIYCDTTGWDPVVAYAGGDRLPASAAFAAMKQGVGGWFYEQEGTSRAAPVQKIVAPPRTAIPPSPALCGELARLAPKAAPETEFALLALVLEAWWREDALEDTVAAYRAAATDHLARARLIATGRGISSPPLERLAAAEPATLEDSRAHYLRVRLLKRELLLSHPLMRFGELLICKRVPPSWSHLVAQYYGWRQRPGGGLYVVEEPGYSMKVRDILRGQLPPGSVLEPRLSYDGKRILFAHVACGADVPSPASLPVNEAGGGERYFHLYEIDVDGSGLRQLTHGRYDDMMAEYLPDGDVVFCSTRRKGYSRCFGPEYSYRWHTYTLHRMWGDGGSIRALSYSDVSEWFPAVAHSGEILHARWDYIDRDAVTHQNLWSVRPDGTNPQAVWGNAVPKPHCTFQVRSIPGSRKIAFIASAHHSITAGPLCVVDPSRDPNSQDAVTRITPLPYPEAEGKLSEWYASPWPLSEDLFLVAYSPYRLRFQGEHMRDPNPDNALGVYVLDAEGNRELLYRDPEIGSTTPNPLRPRSRPAVLADTRTDVSAEVGEMMVVDIYQGLGDVARGTVRELRIVQLFPKTTWLANQPRMGVAGEENGRAILGSVPVEKDGSAYFRVPAHTPVLFQALDEKGMAVQTMRSLTFVQPGEKTSCVGCHEHRMQAPPVTGPLALQRPPSDISPGDLGGRPFGFAEMVQPILDRHCVRCHGGDKPKGKRDLTGAPAGGFTRSYLALCGDPGKWRSPAYDPKLAEKHLVPRFVQRNQIQTTVPGGVYGARGSRLLRMFTADEPHNKVRLGDNDIRRLAAWIDLNAIFYGVYDPEEQARQLRGEAVAMPYIQ